MTPDKQLTLAGIVVILVAGNLIVSCAQEQREVERLYRVCYDHGYPTVTGTTPGWVYCSRRVNGTDEIVKALTLETK